MTDIPITVLMPVYNGEKFLAEAIDSILCQTFKDFEFLIINDGSTDKTKEIIQSYTDPRIRYVENEKNIKLIASLNKGLDLAKGRYIARMDADDISLPERLEKQFSFMEKNSEIGFCGTKANVFEGKLLKKFPETDDDIRIRMFFFNHIPHPSVMLRKSVLVQNNLKYDKNYIHAEDYALWLQMLKFTNVYIIQETLVLHRLHENQISEIYNKEQYSTARKIRLELLSKLGISPTEQELFLYEDYLEKNYPWDRINYSNIKEEVIMLLDLLSKIEKSNSEMKIYDEKLFSTFLAEKYWSIVNHSTFMGVIMFKKYVSSFAYRYVNLSFFMQIKFLIRAIIRYNNRNNFKG